MNTKLEKQDDSLFNLAVALVRTTANPEYIEQRVNLLEEDTFSSQGEHPCNDTKTLLSLYLKTL